MNKIGGIIVIMLCALLVGCTPETVYINQTVEKEVIKVCPPNNCECNPATCNPAPCVCNYEEIDCKTNIKTIVTDNCTNKLNMCNIRLDQKDDYLFDCLQSNITSRYDDLSENLTGCIEERDEYKEELDAIKELLD